MFISLAEFLLYKKIEVPTYHTISEIITKSLQDFEKNLIILLEQNLEERYQKSLMNYWGKMNIVMKKNTICNLKDIN